jgi:hypothetical protein
MNYARGEIGIRSIAPAMAESIKKVMQAQTLTQVEMSQLTSALTGIIGNAEMAEAYIDQADGGQFNRPNKQTSSVSGNKTSVENPFDAKGRLKPDVKYRSGEFGYNYETDSLCRITNFNTGILQITGRDGRLPHNPNTPGKLDGDHAGHLAGDLFGGSPKSDNLVSQLSDVNLSQYRKIENIWAKAIREGKR